MSETYRQMQERQQREYSEFTKGKVLYAFSEKQFAEGCAKLGIAREDAGQRLVAIAPGGAILKEHAQALHDMFERFQEEQDAAIAADPDGNGFIYGMFNYELANHEYSYTGEIDETLDACGLTWEEVQASPKLLNGLKRAMQYQRDNAE